MWTVRWLAACSEEPRFVSPPGDLVVPSLAGCSFTQDAGSAKITWVYDASGKLATDEIIASDGWLTTYTWKGACLSQMVRQGDGSYSETDENIFTCDSRGNHLSWERRLLTPSQDLLSSERYVFEYSYDSNGQIADALARLDSGGSGAGTKVGAASYLWYDESRPLEAIFQNIEGTSDTATWIWDHERQLGWDRRGASEERTMTRTWEGDQLTFESHTEEEDEILWYEYTYESKKAPFPNNLWVGGSSLPPPTGLPRPPSAREFIGELFGSSSIEVDCAEKR